MTAATATLALFSTTALVLLSLFLRRWLCPGRPRVYFTALIALLAVSTIAMGVAFLVPGPLYHRALYKSPGEFVVHFLFLALCNAAAVLLPVLAEAAWARAALRFASDKAIGLAAVVFLFAFLLDVNYSSLGMWASTFDPKGKDDSRLGTPRPIRSDEWVVEFPSMMGQVVSGFDEASSLGTGQYPALTYTVPVKEWKALFFPTEWGFFLFGASYGLAWFWNLRFFLLFMSSFTILRLIVGRGPWPLLGALWVLFSPSVQWWASPHSLNVLAYGQSLFVAIHLFLERGHGLARKLGCGFLVFIFLGAMTTLLYVPLQVSFGYFIIGLTAISLLEAHKRRALPALSIVLAVIALAGVAVIQARQYASHAGPLQAIAHSVYPGSRDVHGGDLSSSFLSLFLINPWLPYLPTVPGSNQCESATFFHFIPIAVLVSIVALIRERNAISARVSFAAAYVVAVLLYGFIGIPASVARATGLSYVQGRRAVMAAGLVGVYLSVWALVKIPEMTLRRRERIVLFLIGSLPVVLGVFEPSYLSYVGATRLVGVAAIFLVLDWLLLAGDRRGFAMVLVPTLGVAAFFVNPVQFGLGRYPSMPIVQNIDSIVKKDPGAIWVGEGNGALSGQLLVSRGAKTITGVYIYPNLDLWRRLDVDGRYADAYNRFAHFGVNLTGPGQGYSFKSPHSDVCTLDLGTGNLRLFDAKYVISRKDLTTMIDSAVAFSRIYGPDAAGYAIFRTSFAGW